MRRSIIDSKRAGESVTRTAERLLDIDNPVVHLPKHVRELRDAARMALQAGDRNVYLEAVEKWKGTVERLGQGRGRTAGAFTMRSATQRLVSDLGRARLDQIDATVDRWVLERARHQARVIARTETIEGYRDVYRQSTENQPYVPGYRWVLSPAHPKPDECDVLANQDAYGLGPGGYPADAVPSTPHANDLCSQVAIVDEQHFRRELNKALGRPEPGKPWLSGKVETGQQWLERQSEAYQRKVLGPTRTRLMRDGHQVLAKDGTVRPVYEILGRPKPVRSAVPAVAARRIIKADRRNQVVPFPKLPAAK